MTDPTERLYERLLVLRCQTGSEDAYRELIARFGPRLRYFLRKRFNDGDRIEDALQEVWLEVFRQLPRLQDAEAFTAWLYRIARGTATLADRRRGVIPSTGEKVEFLAIDDDVAEFSAEDAAAIHQALDRLHVEHREVLVLRFLDDLSYEEIAQIVGCPVGTVRSRIHYAKQALKRFLAPPGET